MFRVRDYIANRTRRSSKVLPSEEIDPDIISTHLALADADAKARADLPEAFAHADEIKATPGREPQHIRGFDRTGRVAECRWCGDDFPAFRDVDFYCTPACSRAYLRFQKGRA